VDEAAERLARGRIVARFDGAAEFGPRALGNRSILAAPGPAEVKDTLNRRVKHREPFRPFAPSVAADRAADYFEMQQPSPFMLRAHRTRARFAEPLAAVTHVDGTARIQTVSTEHNRGYLALIRAYGARAGLDCVLNTSFNVRGEPIVGTPEDALRCFLSTGIDDLFIGPYALEKEKPGTGYPPSSP
jgi:carbamoyltransferase